MAMEDKECLESVKNYINTEEDETYVIPNIEGIEPFTLVDQGSKANLVRGLSEKYCLRANKRLFSELNEEMKNNPNCSYDTCFTKDEYKNNSISAYSIYLKEDKVLDIECEVLGSRVFNFYGIPTVYNKSVAEKQGRKVIANYVASVDCLKPNERFFDLLEIAFIRGGNLLSMHSIGLDKTIDGISGAVARFLDEKQINYSKKEILDFKSFLVYSYMVRVLLLGDSDFKNENAGIIINEKDGYFRPFPNFDLSLLFDSTLTEEKLKIIEDIAVSYPEVLDDFMKKSEKFVTKDKGEDKSPCEMVFEEATKRKSARENLMNDFYSNLVSVVNKANEVKQELAEMEQADLGR